MSFTPFMWFVELLTMVCAFLVFRSRKGPRSFRYLMIVFMLDSAADILSHGNRLLYWDQLWIHRSVMMCWVLWVVGTMFSDRPNMVMRFPVAMNAILFFSYLPMSPETTLAQLEIYRSFGFGLALAIAVIGFVVLVPKGEAGPLHVGLIAFLAAEFSGALLGTILDWAPGLQLLCWAVSMSALVATFRTSSSAPQSHLPASLHAQACG